MDVLAYPLPCGRLVHPVARRDGPVDKTLGPGLYDADRKGCAGTGWIRCRAAVGVRQASSWRPCCPGGPSRVRLAGIVCTIRTVAGLPRRYGARVGDPGGRLHDGPGPVRARGRAWPEPANGTWSSSRRVRLILVERAAECAPAMAGAARPRRRPALPASRASCRCSCQVNGARALRRQVIARFDGPSSGSRTIDRGAGRDR